jgi:WD40 repeat protein
MILRCNRRFVKNSYSLNKYFLSLFIVLFAIQQAVSAQKKKGTDELYFTQLKTAEAYYRHNQIGEAKNILLSVPENKRTFEWDLLFARMDRSIQTLAAHSKPVVGIAISKDGKLLATGSADSSIIIWDASTYQIMRRIAAHKGQVTTLDFSPDGKTLISGSTDKSLRLWNVMNGTEIRNYNSEFKQGIYQVKFSNDGTMLGVVSWEFVKSVQGFAKVLDVATGKLIQRFDTDDHPASAIKFSADNKKIYTGTWGFQIKQHDIASGNLDWNYDMREFDYYTAVQSLDVSPDNKYVVQSGKDNKIRILNTSDGKLIRQIESWEGHKEWVNGVRFSPDGKYFASVSDDGLLKVWETATAKTIFTFKGHTAGINQLTWHPDGKRIFTTSGDNTIKVWDINSPGEINFNASVVGPWNAPVSPDGKWMAPVNSDKIFALYNLSTGKQQIFFDSLTAFSSAFSTDGKYVAAGNRNIIIYDIAQKKKILTGKGHTGVIYGMDYYKNLNLFVTAADKTVRVWNTTDTNAVHTVSTISNVFTAKFSPDGKNIYAGCTNGKVKIISTDSWTVVDSLQSGTTIFNMAVSADNKYLITGGNAEVFAWDIKKKKETALKGHTKWVYGVAFHPSLPLAVTVSYDRTVRFWDVEKGINTLTLFGFDHELYTVTFTSDGKKLLLTETGGLAHVINL